MPYPSLPLLAKPLGILVLCFLLFWLIVGIRLIAADARKRGKPAVPVVLLALVYFPLGLLIWIVFRPAPLGQSRQPFSLEDRRVQ